MKEKKKFHRTLYFLTLLIWFFFVCGHVMSQARYSYTRPLMGSAFNLVFYAPTDSTARVASDSAFARINYLNAILSDYLDGSETSRMSASAGLGQWVYVGPVLFDILEKSIQISHQTHGAFDCTIGPVVQLWRRAMRRSYFPEKSQIKLARRAVGYRLVALDPQNKRVKLRRKNMRLDFGAIGKGYAADEALAVLRHFGISSAFLDAGGDLAIGQAPPLERGWAVAVGSGGADTTTRQILWLQNCGVATSGGTYRYLAHQGQRYSHIADPRTGVGLQTHLRTTVVAQNGTIADALATAFSVLGIKKGKKVYKKIPKIGVWLIENKLQIAHIWKSPGFDLLFSGKVQ